MICEDIILINLIIGSMILIPLSFCAINRQLIEGWLDGSVS